MDDFAYRNAELHCGDVPVQRIAESVGTPAYVYSAATLTAHYDRLAAAFAPLDPLICYSIKSCPNVHLCRLLAQRGAGFDVVSGGELHRALKAGGDPKKIVFAGVGKTDAEILAGIDAAIGWFNVESEAELENLTRLASSRNATVNAALRVNPDVDPKTHVYTSTGKRESKFGVDLDRARALFQSKIQNPKSKVRLSGLHLHLGSPVNSVAPYVDAIRKGLALIDDLRAAGHAIDTLDIGGGFGAHYRDNEAPLAAEYAEAIVPLLRGRNLRIILEPGRSIAANAGILLTRVLYVKQSGDKQFIITDAGMNDLIRPALYQAYHFIWPVRPPPDMIPGGSPEQTVFSTDCGTGVSPVLPLTGETPVPHEQDRGARPVPHTPARGESLDFPGLQLVDIVGPVCESGDFLAQNRRLPPVQRGDLLAVFTAGAYGMSMASNYNSRPRPAEVLVESNAFRLIRRRETYEDLLAAEQTEHEPKNKPFSP